MALIENNYVGDGSTVLYSFTFPYIDVTDIKVSLDGVNTTEYTLANATTVEFNEAPAVDVAIRIYRNTEIDALKATFFPGSVIRAQDLNDNFEQQLYVVQEASFDNSQSAEDSAEARRLAEEAKVEADSAVSEASEAKAEASEAKADASQAAQDAAQAAQDSSDAQSSAESAEQAALDAVQAVQDAAVYFPVPDVASIPLTPADDTRIRVEDATGIDAFSPLEDLPVGPVWDSGVYVKIIYQSELSSWVFVEYAANDPDDRYSPNALKPGDNVSELINDSGFITDAGVTRIIAGSNITVSGDGTGEVTVSSTGGGSDGGIEEAPEDGQQYARQNKAWSVVQGGGGGPTTEYNGASAWARFNGLPATDDADRLEGSLNIASVTRTGTGKYDVVFITPMPSANYAINADVWSTNVNEGSPSPNVSAFNITATGFSLDSRDASGEAGDRNVSLVVHALNALPPKGGTGADAWAQVQGIANNGPTIVNASFNVESAERVGQGVYRINFTTPFPSLAYAVIATEIDAGAVGENLCCKTLNYALDSVDIGVFNYQGGSANPVDPGGISVVVHATNATLPQTVTQEQIEAAINNPGVSAWGYVDGTSGSLQSGLNIQSVVRESTGRYLITFATPMPNADYSVSTSCDTGGDAGVAAASKTATSFIINTRALSSSAQFDGFFSFQVVATNALPLTGGTGADAWLTCSGSGGLGASFNIANVTKAVSPNGQYTVTFTTPMPTADYSVQVSHTSGYGFVNVYNKTTTGFQVQCRSNSGVETDISFQAVVNATNAQLPDTVTKEQLDPLVSPPYAFGTFTNDPAHNVEFNINVNYNNEIVKIGNGGIQVKRRGIYKIEGTALARSSGLALDLQIRDSGSVISTSRATLPSGQEVNISVCAFRLMDVDDYFTFHSIVGGGAGGSGDFVGSFGSWNCTFIEAA